MRAIATDQFSSVSYLLEGLAAIATFGLGATWIYAGSAKLANSGALEERIRNAPGLLEDPWLTHGARVLPYIEVAAGVSVITMPVVGGAVSIAALLILTSLKPLVGQDCGCFGPKPAGPLRWLNPTVVNPLLIVWSVVAVLLGSTAQIPAIVRLSGAALAMVAAIAMFVGGVHGHDRVGSVDRLDSPRSRRGRIGVDLPPAGRPDRGATGELG
jgi:hypothetical protein